MGDLQDYWFETLNRDLVGFADPGTEVNVEPISGGSIKASWTQRARERTASFRLTPDGDFRWLPEAEESPKTYREFLSSEGLGDFVQLSNAIVRAFSAPQHYVPTKASIDANGVPPPAQLSHELILSRCSDALTEPQGKTQMLFLKGDAGAGKTTLLREITRKQAERYRNGESPFLFLYVSAQGRALSNLRDALSGELDDLRAGFTRDAVPPLVRQGLIVPIIDGFDELLGAAGYGDAFGSLHEFLNQLGGLGALIVSARSSFYDVEFLGREGVEGARTSGYDVIPVTLHPWGEEEIYQYLALVRSLSTISEDDCKAVSKLPARDRDLLAKPFFASRFHEFVDSPDGMKKGASLSEFLVESYIRRESEKIVDRDGRPLLGVNEHRGSITPKLQIPYSGEGRGG